VTVSGAEFQRLVYSGHLLGQMDEKPELDASLVVLLELQRRNPHANPAALADVSREALARYRTNAPPCIRNSGWRDEILAAYLDAFRQVPGRTNFNPATLALIHSLVTHLNAPAAMQQSELLNSGFERLLNTEEELPQRQSLVNASASRVAGHSTFRDALDRLLVPEIGLSLTNTPAEVINATPALSNNPTLRALLQFSETNATGGLQISLSQLKELFATETQTLQETVAANTVVGLEISQRRSDLLAYLGNQPMLSADLQRETEVRQLQAQKIAASHASFNVVSSLASYRDARLGDGMKTVGDSLANVAKGIGMLSMAGGLNMVGGYAALFSAGLGIFGLFADSGPSPDEAILEGIDDIKNMIRDFSEHVDYRFDRVDQSLTEIYQTLNSRLDQIDLQLGQVQGDVNQIRRDLLVTQNDLHRLERELYDYLNAGFRRDLVLVINGALGYEAIYGNPMDYPIYTQIPDGPENTFYTWAFSNAKDPLSSPATFTPADLTDGALLTQLNARPLESGLNYLNQYLSNRFTLPPLGPTPVPNPRDWFVAAQAYLQLAVENPLHFRRVAASRLNNIIANGQELQSFFQNLLFTGSGPNLRANTNLHNALLGHYEGKLNTFTNQVRTTQQQYANDHHFPMLETWRQWGLAAPRVTAASTELLESHNERPVVPAEFIPVEGQAQVGIIALGGFNNGSHGLALQAGGTVAAWGDTVPVGLSNVIALAAGFQHSLALRADGTVIGWGDSEYGKNTSPASATNVMAIGAGGDHNLAVREDGRVVGWGYNYYGQATGVPTTNWPYCSTGLIAVAGQTITNAVAAGGGFYYSLVLKADGKVVAWGTSGYGETNVPAGLSDVAAIAAGGFHSLAIQSNGMIIAWGVNNEGQTNVPPGLSNVTAVAAGSHHSLALRSDGTVVAWGANQYGQTSVPPGLSNVVAIAADYLNSLALRSDGTFVVWGYNDWLWDGPLPVPAGLTNVVAVDGGDFHVLALKADGTVASWGYPYQYNYGQTNVPAGLSNVVAIAAGKYHSVALRSNGTVVAWGTGEWNYGQSDVPTNLNNVVAITAGPEFSAALKSDGTVVSWGRNIGAKPADVTNVVAISAGTYFCEALTADGRVRAWGDNSWKQCNVPAGLSNVVAIAAGSLHSLALRADGTVVSWGRNDGGCTNVPAGLSNVVAIAAGPYVSVALKADGTATAWGVNDEAQGSVPREATNTVAIGAGYRFSLYVHSTGTADGSTSPALQLVRNPIPVRAREHLWAVNADVITNLNDGSHALHAAGEALAGSKALLEAVLSLAMPYTLERDDVLHGLFYGTEPLMDLDAARQVLSDEMKAIQSPPFVPVSSLNQVAAARFACFRERLQTRLNDLAQTGQPEIPRMVGHTLRLLNLLRDAWAAAPPPALEIWSEGNSPRLVLYGEPYAHHALQECTNLNLPYWTSVTATNWHNEETLLRTTAGSPRRFYRAMLPVP